MTRCRCCRAVGHFLVYCAMCAALVFSGQPEAPTRLRIDTSLAALSNVVESVASTSSVPTLGPVGLTYFIEPRTSTG